MEANESAFPLEEIKLITTGCYGTCPLFTMTVDGNGAARYEAKMYNKQKGFFGSTIPAVEMGKLTDILDHLSVEKLDSAYAVDGTDVATYTIEIRYAGTVRKIVDYGGMGTPELGRLYLLLFGWRDSIKWKELDNRQEAARPNKIDQLRTKEEVEVFLAEKIDKDYKEPGFFYFKLDIDGDGLTDLLVNGRRLLVVMGQGESYYAHYLGTEKNGIQPMRLLSIDSSSTPKKLVLLDRGRRDTLIYKLGCGFMEYNAHPEAQFDFDEIKFSAGGCLGTCPIFTMTVRGDRTVRYEGIEYTQRKGTFLGMIPDDEWADFDRTLRYLSPDRLDSAYSIDWTDYATVTLEIIRNGHIKKMVDYGEIGTFGLQRLYAFFFRWRTVVMWGARIKG